MCVSVCKGYFRGRWNILGFFQLFVQVGAGGGGKYVSMCKACGKLGGVRGCALPGSFDFGLLLDTIWWNLGLFLHKHRLSFIVSLQ